MNKNAQNIIWSNKVRKKFHQFYLTHNSLLPSVQRIIMYQLYFGRQPLESSVRQSRRGHLEIEKYFGQG